MPDSAQNSFHDKTDEELVVLSLQDKQAFGLLVDRFEKKLLRYVHRIARVNNEEAEDLLQDVFLKAYINLNKFDTSLKFSSWIYRITHNTVISSFRKKKSRPNEIAKFGIDEYAEQIASNIDLEKEVDRIYLQEKFEGIFKTIKIKYRDVIVLKYIEEKTYKEISDILQIPEGTVAIRLSRAKNVLRKKIKHLLK